MPTREWDIWASFASFRFWHDHTNRTLAYTSQHEPLPLCELERAPLLAAGTGVTGWNFGIPFTVNQSNALSNYSLRMTGRTLPSTATIGVSESFFADDFGIYVTHTRDFPPERLRESTGEQDDVARIFAHTRAARRCNYVRSVSSFLEELLIMTSTPSGIAISPVRPSLCR